MTTIELFVSLKYERIMNGESRIGKKSFFLSEKRIESFLFIPFQVCLVCVQYSDQIVNAKMIYIQYWIGKTFFENDDQLTGKVSFN